MHLRSAVAFLMFATVRGQSQVPADAAQREARAVLAEMIAVNTSLDRGDVTPLAEKLAARFRAAGVPARDVMVVGPEAKNRNLVVRVRGQGPAKPVLFLAHLDVVDALRADWSMEPFALTEKDGWYYGRGAIDDKGPAATLVAGMLALIRSKAPLARDIILALSSGEENADEPGAAWLVRTRRDLVNAEWVFNFDAGGPAIDHEKLSWLELQGSEKVYWSIRLSVQNTGGHSSLPRADNAVYGLAHALVRLEQFRFPIHLTEVARAQLTARAQFVPPEEAAAIRAVLKSPLALVAADRLAARTPAYNALLRTTCIPTMLKGGHAANALPQLAAATVNCRLIPGENSVDILATLRRVVGDTAVVVTEIDAARPSPPSPLLPERLALVNAASRAAWGREIPISPVQETGATDGLFYRNAGIPVYGLHGIAQPVGEERLHGKDERILAKSFQEGVVFATALIRATASLK